MTQLSLLWPDGAPAKTWQIPAETTRDLEMEAIVAAFCPHGPYREAVAAIMTQLCLEPDAICYRQQVVDDLQAQPQLAAALRGLLPLLDELALFSYRKSGDDSSLHEVVARAGELELLIEATDQLQRAFTAVYTPLQSTAIKALRDHVVSLAADANFQQLADELPLLLSQLRTSASITIGVNLDHYMRPEEAVLLAVNDFRFSESTLLDRLLGRGIAEGKGVAPLHTPPLVSRSSGMITGGLRAIFTTHLHDLAAAVPEINAETAGDSRVISLVASPLAEEPIASEKYSYRVQPGPPLGHSYATHIATRYGISYEQLQALAAQRQLLKE